MLLFSVSFLTSIFVCVCVVFLVGIGIISVRNASVQCLFLHAFLGVFLGIASDMHHTYVGVTYSPQCTCVGVDFHTAHVVA